jgi:uncharacterized protein
VAVELEEQNFQASSWRLIAIFGQLVQDAIEMNALRLFYLGLGWLSVGLGVVGIIMPILPTTPFLLLAVWAFSRSSPELAEKLRNHPKAGPYIRAWQDHGVIPPLGKFLAITMMTVTGAYLIVYGPLPLWAAISACAGMFLVAVYIVTRPGAPPQT